jgi:putative transposase
LKADRLRSKRSSRNIIAVLTEQERGMATAEVCRKHGVSPASFYKWKAKFGGMDVSDARKLKTLETENARLKRLLADSMLDNVVLKDLLGKS